MKTTLPLIVKFVVNYFIFLCLCGVCLGQTNGDFRSAQTGNWNSTSTWQKYVSGSWSTATSTPDYLDGAITIRTGHSVSLTANENVDQLVVETGANLFLTTGAINVKDGTGDDMIVYGTVRHDQSGNITYASGSPMVTFASGSKYQHNYQNVNGSIPVSPFTWDINSTFEVIGYTTVGGDIGGTQNQVFGNFVWNCPNQSSSFNLGSKISDVRGNLIVMNTGSGQVNFGQGSSQTYRIDGNLEVQGGIVAIAGAGADQTVNLLGDLIVSGGTLIFSDGSGDATLNMKGNYNHSGGTMSNVSSGTVIIAFEGTSTQTCVASSTLSGSIHYQVKSGATLDLGTTLIGNGSTGSFQSLSGSTLQIGHSGGIASSGSSGNVRVSGARTFTTLANYTYNGIAAQITGTGLSTNTIYANVTFTNASGVTLTNNLNLTGILTVSGLLIPPATNTITGSGTLTGSGTVRVTKTGTNAFLTQYTITNKTLTNLTLEYAGASSQTASSTTSYGLVVANSSGVTLGANATVSNNLQLTNGTLTLNGYTLNLNSGATITRTGGALSETPSFGATVHVIYGSYSSSITASYEIPSSSSVLSNLSIANTYGVTLGDNITVNGTLTLTAGNFNLGSYNLTMTSSGVLSGGSSSSFIYTGGTGAFKHLDCVANTTRAFPVGHTNSTAGYVPFLIQFNTGHTTDDFSVIAIDKVTNDGTRSGTTYTSDVLKMMIQIVETVSGGSNVNLIYQWNATDEANSFDRSSIHYSRFNGSTWVDGSTGTATGSNPYQFTENAYTGNFGSTGIGDSNGPLPVSLLSFTAVRLGADVQLNWITASEQNNDFFTIEKSRDGESFEVISLVYGAGNSQSILEYIHTDLEAGSAQLFYRLSQTDFDGTTTRVKTVVIGNINGPGITKIYPMPAGDVVTLDLQSDNQGLADISIVNMAGVVVFDESIHLTKVRTTYRITTTDFPTGIYVVRYDNGNNSTLQKIRIFH